MSSFERMPRVKNKFARTILLLAISFAACVAVAILSSVLAYCIPTAPMEANLKSSVRQLSDEGLYHKEIEGGETFQFDNFTVAIMLNEAGHGSSNPLRNAMLNPLGSGPNPIQGLEKGIGLPDKDITGRYSQYWHGYLTILKPLLVFLDLAQIRKLLLVTFITLLALASILLAKEDGTLTGVVLAVTFATFNISVMVNSLSLAVCPFIAVVASLFVLRMTRTHSRTLPEDNLWWAIPFFLIGALTAYFDFLCTPIITLGVPLALLLYRSRGQRRQEMLRCAIGALLLCVSWALGYAALFASKWVVATLFTGENVISEGLLKVAERSSERASERADAESIDRLQAVIRNVKLAFPKWSLLIAAVIVIVFVALAVYLYRKNRRHPNLWWAIPLFLTALLPNVWYLLAANHSYQHAFFTYRGLLVSALCIGLICAGLLQDATGSCDNITHARHLSDKAIPTGYDRGNNTIQSDLDNQNQ